ncbi:MAG: hypothetical protein RLZZ143_3578 [Cyanobacteriota bacterium]
MRNVGLGPTDQPGSWRPHWQKLLRQLKEAVPTGWTVIVPADRGLYAPWLYQLIAEAGWHPFLGINQQGLVKISSHGQWQPLDALVSAPGQSWSGQGVCFGTNTSSLSASYRQSLQDITSSSN